MEIRISNLTKTFQGFRAVDDVTLSMENGVYGLLGVNGAGKTTLMRMLCTLIRPDEGEILCGGEDIFSLGAEYRRLLGYLPQDFGFYPEFSVEDYMLYVASIKGLRPAIARRRTRELLDLVGLEGARGKKMKKLSGGMKRRAGIAQAMLNDPKILILDEPTAGLDPNERIRFRKLISELSRDRLVLLSTHIVSDVEYIASEIILMKGGRICQTGTQEELLQSVPVRAWSVLADECELAEWQKKFLVANMRQSGEGVELRVLSERAPVSTARRESLGLEDVFLYYFGERTGAENDAI